MNLYLFKSSNSVLSQEVYTILTNRVKQLSREFNSVESGLKGREVNIIISDKNVIRNLNKAFRKEDKATDILTFPLDSQIFGELWICPDVIKENAEKFDEEFEKELLRIVIHGLLHLAGYDHKGYFEKGRKQKEEIFKLQEKVLEMLY